MKVKEKFNVLSNKFKNKKLKFAIISLSILICFSIGLLLTLCNKSNAIESHQLTSSAVNGLAIYVKDIGDTDYEATTTIPVGNYHLDKSKSYCKGNGKIGIYYKKVGKITYSFTAGDQCYVYFDERDVIPANTTLSTGIVNLTNSTTSISDEIATDTHSTYTNYRYVGSNPDNYVCLSEDGETCEDYETNTTDNYAGTGSGLFRIVGTFSSDTHGKSGETLVKLIKAGTLGLAYYDYKENTFGSSIYTGGSNEWSDSQLMYMLNGYGSVGYDENNNIVYSNYKMDSSNNIYDGNNNKIYQSIGSYINGGKDVTVYYPGMVKSNTFDLQEKTIDGLNIKQSALIETVNWPLGGIATSEYDCTNSDATIGIPNSLYTLERGTNNCNDLSSSDESYCSSTRSVKWRGKIGLIYPSDYGYATNGTYNSTSCVSQCVNEWYEQKKCYSDDWILYASSKSYSLSSSIGQWFISPNSSYTGVSMENDSGGSIYSYNASTSRYVRPSFYLKSNVYVAGGAGTSDDPYLLVLPDSVTDLKLTRTESDIYVNATLKMENGVSAYGLSTSNTTAPTTWYTEDSNGTLSGQTYNLKYKASTYANYYLWAKDEDGNTVVSSQTLPGSTTTNTSRSGYTITSTLNDPDGLSGYIVVPVNASTGKVLNDFYDSEMTTISNSPTTYSMSYTATEPGYYRIYIRDSLGNITKHLYYYLLDGDAPTVSGISKNGYKITATLADNYELAGYAVTTSSTAPTSDDDWTSISGTSYSLSKTVSSSAPGYYYVHVKDKRGNTKTSIYGYLLDGTKPTISNVSTSFLTIKATLEDNFRLASYAVTTSSTAPSSDDDWTSISGNLTSYSLSYLASSNGTYYIHVKDKYGNVKNSSSGYSLSSSLASSYFASTSRTSVIKDSQTISGSTYNNYRYTGKNPDNYACLTSDCTQLFRIVGVFRYDSHGKSASDLGQTYSYLVKMVTADTLGYSAKDYKVGSSGGSNVGSSLSSYGSNDWTDAQLMFMLNGYYNTVDGTDTKTTYSTYTRTSSTTDNVTTYTIKANTTTYSSSSNDIIYKYNTSYLQGGGANRYLSKPQSASGGDYTMANTSVSIQTLKSTQASMIARVTWHLGGYTSTEAAASTLYVQERGTSTYCTTYTCTYVQRPSTWTGKIGLLYPSDYAYATSNRTDTCISDTAYLNAWSSDCYENDWLLYPGSRSDTTSYTARNQWTITPLSNASSSSYTIKNTGSIGSYYAYNAYYIRPSFYINASVKVVGGSGTSSDPYILLS